jgi:hypothetical protein
MFFNSSLTILLCRVGAEADEGRASVQEAIDFHRPEALDIPLV